MSSSLKLPLWLNILTAVFFLSNLFVFGGLALFSPSTAFPDAGPTADFPIQFFAIRHIAFAAPLGYGLFKQDIKILWACFLMFMVMTSLDVALLFLNGYYIPVIGDVPLLAKIVLAFGGFIGPVFLALTKLTSLKRHLSES
ncbi:MAG: hypothetical protein AAF587_24130 [Bacteroidota bacterium]